MSSPAPGSIGACYSKGVEAGMLHQQVLMLVFRLPAAGHFHANWHPAHAAPHHCVKQL
jgi:hypothetical protein